MGGGAALPLGAQGGISFPAFSSFWGLPSRLMPCSPLTSSVLTSLSLPLLPSLIYKDPRITLGPPGHSRIIFSS